MSARQVPCRKCGDAVVLATAPNGGVMPLSPDPAGKYRVDVLGRDLVVLSDGQETSARTRRYDPHSCVPAGKAVPRGGRPTQLTIGAEQ
jgi:hypothetical protein